MAEDPFDLQRFIDAQNAVFDQVRAELEAGQKESHWMWFVFPQLAGLGFSPMAKFYAIGSREEANAYLIHPLLGPRLHDLTGVMLGHAGRSALEILGPPDDVKFRSSMTLFGHTAPNPAPFRDALHTFFDGEACPATLQLLGS